MSTSLHPGSIVQTNYSGPYRVVEVERGCTCPHYWDELEWTDAQERYPSEPHVHLVVVPVDLPREKDHCESKHYYIGGFAENDTDCWPCVWVNHSPGEPGHGENDELFIIGETPDTQMEFSL